MGEGSGSCYSGVFDEARVGCLECEISSLGERRGGGKIPLDRVLGERGLRLTLLYESRERQRL